MCVRSVTTECQERADRVNQQVTIDTPIHLLPCGRAPTQPTTLEQEGCLEHQIVKRDRQVDALDRTIFTTLGDFLDDLDQN
jgi:hypothetical protein